MPVKVLLLNPVIQFGIFLFQYKHLGHTQLIPRNGISRLLRPNTNSFNRLRRRILGDTGTLWCIAVYEARTLSPQLSIRHRNGLRAIQERPQPGSLRRTLKRRLSFCHLASSLTPMYLVCSSHTPRPIQVVLRSIVRECTTMGNGVCSALRLFSGGQTATRLPPHLGSTPASPARPPPPANGR